jgi:hypothetical protein
MNQKQTLHITGNIKGQREETLYIQRIVDTIVAIDTINIDSSSVFESDIDYNLLRCCIY